FRERGDVFRRTRLRASKNLDRNRRSRSDLSTCGTRLNLNRPRLRLSKPLSSLLRLGLVPVLDLLELRGELLLLILSRLTCGPLSVQSLLPGLTKLLVGLRALRHLGRLGCVGRDRRRFVSHQASLSVDCGIAP